MLGGALALRPDPSIFIFPLTDTAEAVPLGVGMNMCEDETVSREGLKREGRRLQKAGLLQTLPTSDAFLGCTSTPSSEGGGTGHCTPEEGLVRQETTPNLLLHAQRTPAARRSLPAQQQHAA